MFCTRPSITGLSRSLNPEISDLCDQYYPILTDHGNAQRFSDLFSETVCYVPARGDRQKGKKPVSGTLCTLTEGTPPFAILL